ncbi:MAG: efflux RND transporter permease subunit [Vicinamibacterales bacterium]
MTSTSGAGAAARSHWTARHGKPILFAVLTTVAAGLYLGTTIPVSVFPEVDFPRVLVGVDNGVAPINQMMVTVTRAIEEAVNSVQGLERVQSVTSRGTAEINLFFSWRVDMFQTLERVNAAIARVQPELPATAKLRADRLTFAAFPIVGYSLTSDTVPQTRLWELATYDIKPRLNRTNGVSTVVVQGGQEPEFEVRPDPAKLLQTSTSVPAMLDAIGRSNMIDSPGLFEDRHRLVLGLVSGQVRSVEDLANIVVRMTPQNVPVRIGDVATVGPSVKPVYVTVTANARPAVLLNVFRQPDSNTVAVAGALEAESTRIRAELPRGVELQTFYNQSGIVNDSITSVRDAVLIGLVLASLIMVVFLRDWGTSLVAGLVIPATLAITFIVLRALGESFNLMTLGGLAAAVGLVIDDAIVVVETIVLHREEGRSREEAIERALAEIRVPLIGSTVTPVVVFLPLVAITGVTGTFFRALAVTVATALLTSLVLALTWTPTLSHFVLRDRSAGQPTRPPSGRMTRFYERVLRSALGRPWLLAAACLFVVGAADLSYRALGSDLLPSMDEGGFIIDYVMPAGASLAETDRVLAGVEDILRATKEVEGTSRRTGLQLGLAAVTEANTGDITVRLKRDRRRPSDEIVSEVREAITTRYPMLDVEFVQLLQDMIGDLTGAPEPLAIKLFSQDPTLLVTWAPRVAQALKRLPGVVDVLDGVENTVSGPSTLFRVDPLVAARAGFTPEEVEVDASAILQGEPAPTPVVLHDRAYTIRVRFPDATRASLDAMANTLLVSSTGRTGTLGSLATVESAPGEHEVRRENLQRDVTVTARLEGVDLGAGVAAAKTAIAALHLPASIRVEYGGQYEEQQRSFHDLLIVLVLAVLLVFTVLLFEFGGFAAPFAIVVSAVLSTVGVFAALLATGTTFNLSSFMGLIMVIGIVAKNGILLLDAEERFRREDVAPVDAMIRAGERRLRPIAMTALATVAGMVPLAFGLGAGSQMLQPLAIAVIGGVTASMVLSLVITPLVHHYLADRGRP